MRKATKVLQEIDTVDQVTKYSKDFYSALVLEKLQVAKHGNRSISSVPSADLLEILDIDINFKF